MACKGACSIRGKSVLREIWRIAENAVETAPIGIEVANIGVDDTNLSGKRTCADVLTSLCRSLGINLNGNDFSIRNSLGSHQGNKAGTRADVQDAPAAVNRRPCSKQYSVCADLHCATVVPNGKLSESENRLTHIS